MQEVLDQFNIKGEVGTPQPFGNGHIHDSYKAPSMEDENPGYLLQRINHEVFKDVPGVMNNIQKVTQHIAQKINPIDDQITLSLVKTTKGDCYYEDEAGNYWRVYHFLDGLISYDLAESAEQVYEGARSYGFFMKYLDDLSGDDLVETIPDFHNLISRLDAFEQSTQQPFQNRDSEVKSQIDFVRSNAKQLTTIQQLWKEGVLKSRVTHNDTKFNNVLLTPAGEGKCVVDLDTVMPGVVHFDFGDGIRTGACSASEEESDLQLVGLDLERFRGFSQGYLEVTRDYLSPVELEYLPISGALLAFIMGVRFLTDYLNGDIYYKIKYEDHNMVRAKNQLHLTKEILNCLPDLQEIIKKA